LRSRASTTVSAKVDAVQLLTAAEAARAEHVDLHQLVADDVQLRRSS
jgi:hypothetical protein